MAQIWTAADNVEPVDSSTIMAIANIANYGTISGCAQTYSVSTMEKTVASGIVILNGAIVTVAGNNVTLVADPLLPRWTWTAINSSGVAVLVSGDPSATPAVPQLGDTVGISLDLVQAGLTIANDASEKLDKRVIYVPWTLDTSAQGFVELSGHKGFFGGIGTGSAAAPGFALGTTTAMLNASTITRSNVAGDEGSALLTTDANNNDYAEAQGPFLIATGDWGMEWRGKIPSSASQTVIIGGSPNGTPADQNGIIAFRVSGTGNVIGVCDNGGTESTRDTSATGATELTLRIEVRSGGTIVRFYKNNVQIGADVTTNIPAAVTRAVCGISTQTTAAKAMNVWDWYGWRET